MHIIDEIQKSVAWLKANITSNDLQGKLQEAERLAINSYYLASILADYHEKMNTAEFMYKSAIASSIVNSTESVAKAEAKAKVAYESMGKDVIDNENTYKRMQLLLSQCNVIIEQIRQTNSALKQERRFENHNL